MNMYYAIDEPEAFRLFLEEFAQNLVKAQQFYDEVYVVEITTKPQVFSMSSVFGKDLSFPDIEAIKDIDNIL